MKNKLENCGTPMIFVGYSSKQPSDCYKMFNPKTKSFVFTRNITWLDKFYPDIDFDGFDSPNLIQVNTIQVNEDAFNVEVDPFYVDPKEYSSDDSINNINDQDVYLEVLPPDPEVPKKAVPDSNAGGNITTPAPAPNPSQIRTRSQNLDTKVKTRRQGVEPKKDTNPKVSKTTRELKNLDTSYNPMFVHHSLTEEMMLLIKNVSETGDPVTYYEAMSSPNKDKWWSAMCEEFNSMERRQVWKLIKRDTVPKDRRLIGCRWVYVEKDDGRFRARAVAKGFSQIPGKDFQENFAPVINEVSMRIILIYMLLYAL